MFAVRTTVFTAITGAAAGAPGGFGDEALSQG
jgi:hypothetical protein